MNEPVRFALIAIVLCLVAMTQPMVGAQEDAATAPSTALVTRDVLEAKIKEVESAADLTDDAKTTLVDLYRKASSNLEAARASGARAGALEEAARTGPARTELIRKEIEAAKGSDPLETLNMSLESPLQEIDRQLQKEQADLAAVDARRADFERRLADEDNRPTIIRQRVAEATQQQQEIAAALQVPPKTDEGPTLNQARRWVLEAHSAALSAEIKMLDRELLSQPMRLDLLKAERDKGAGSVAWIGERVRVLSELINRKRQLEAEQAKLAAEEARLEIAGLDPHLARLAERNAKLTDELQAMVTRLDALDREQDQASGLAARIESDFNDTRATLESGGLTEGLGQLLLRHRETLPDSRIYARRIADREEQIAQLGISRLHHREEARRLADLDQAVAEHEAKVTAEKTPQLRDKLRELVAQRQLLLGKALEGEEFYLRKLRELDAAERKLIEASHAYDDLLSEHLLWLRTADPTRLQDLGNLPEEAKRLLSPAMWLGMTRQVARAPVFWLALIAAVALSWKRRALIEAIEATAKPLTKPTTDRFAYTVRALALTLLAAAPLSLVLALIGWQLHVLPPGTDPPHGLGFSLLRVSLHLYILRALSMMCIPRGLATAHFRWPEHSVRLLRVGLDRLTWVYVPAVLVVLFALDLYPVEGGGMLAKLGLLVFYPAFALFFYRVLHPKRGALVHLRPRQHTGLLFRTYPLWFPLLLAVPLGLVVLALTGYSYSVTTGSRLFLDTLWMIAGLIVLHALALRWLRLVRRRLAYEAERERRQEELAAKRTEESEAAGEDDALEFDEPEVDLEALSDDSRELVKIVTIFAGLVGLYLIWSPLLPALRILDDINLWYHTVTVDGEEKRLPITLADIGLALIYAAGAAVLAKRLPALLEMFLLQRFDMSAGGRYTVTTLTTYAIVTIGILLVFNTIGAQWSQLQWLVAALGVGIGFGLQEIVANFISGIIILFERPIRVGDIVTVGDTDGVVTRIRIRATTIRNWDRKELLVPNKEFITGRLLNWSLSDQITRVVIVVGVAYGTDVDKAHALMRETAEENEHVLDDPKPVVSFEGFGDNSLTLLLRAFLDNLDHRMPTITALHKAINAKFNEAGIVIAFPQRDLHLDTNRPLRVSIEDPRQAKPMDGDAK